MLRPVGLRRTVHAGSSPSPSAAGQGIDEAEAVDAISNLLSKSLIATSPAGRRLRYRLLDTTRAFVGDKLVESGEAARVARAHAEYFRDFLHDISVKSTGMLSAGGFLPYADHLPNVRAALSWSFSEAGNRAIGVDLAAGGRAVLRRADLADGVP